MTPCLLYEKLQLRKLKYERDRFTNEYLEGKVLDWWKNRQKYHRGVIFFHFYQMCVILFFFTKISKSCHGGTLSNEEIVLP